MTFEREVNTGFFPGFASGVGCALAAMHSIWMGGCRATVKDATMSAPPERTIRERSKLRRRSAVS